MKAKKKIEFKLGEIVVYPKHGVGEIISTETMEIANIKTLHSKTDKEYDALLKFVGLNFSKNDCYTDDIDEMEQSSHKVYENRAKEDSEAMEYYVNKNLIKEKRAEK